jgi:hypothetical protein
VPCAREQPFGEDGNENTARGGRRKSVLNVERLRRDPREGLSGALGEVVVFELRSAELDPKRRDNDHAGAVVPSRRVEELTEVELNVREQPSEYRSQYVERRWQERRATRGEEYRQLRANASRHNEAACAKLGHFQQPGHRFGQA